MLRDLSQFLRNLSNRPSKEKSNLISSALRDIFPTTIDSTKMKDKFGKLGKVSTSKTFFTKNLRVLLKLYSEINRAKFDQQEGRIEKGNYSWTYPTSCIMGPYLPNDKICHDEVRQKYRTSQPPRKVIL